MSAPAGHPLPPPGDAPRLVGREREQGALRELLAQALAGRGGVALIGGEAGIGKTTLAEDLCHRAAAGALVLVGHCYDLADTPPYGPWLEALDGVPALRELLPKLRDATRAAALGGGGQAALFDQVREALADLAARQPLVVLVDDLHWADPASLDLLRHLARAIAALPALILVTYRSDELGETHPLAQRLPFLVREAHATRLDLPPLREAAVRALLADRYRLGEGDAARLAAFLDARAEGNPLYVGELLRTLEEAEALQRTGDGWAVGDLAGARTPALLRQIVTDRLFRLGKEARDLLRVAAVIGQEAPYTLWLAAGETTEDELDAVIEHAAAIGVLEERPDGAGVRFRHALLREAVYEGIPALRRQRLHRLAGDALLARPNPDPDAVAYHLRQAGDARAAGWLVRAGERAQRSYAWLTAADRYEAALALMDSAGAEQDERAWLLVRLALMRRYADPERSIAYLDEIANGHVTPALIAAARYYRGANRCLNDDLSGGLPEMAAAVAALDALPPADLDALIQRWGEEIGDDAIGRRHGILATWLSIAGRFAEAREMAARAIGGPPASAPPLRQDGLRAADAYAALGRTYAVQGHPEEALAALSYARERYRAAGSYALLYSVLGDQLTLVALPYATDDVAGRERLVDEAEHAYARATGAIADRSTGLIRHRLLLLEGRWQELPQTRRDQHPVTDAQLRLARNVMGLLAHHQGQPHHAWQRVREVLPLGPNSAPGGADFRSVVEMQRLAALLALEAGDLPAARGWLEANDRWLDWADAHLGRAEGQISWAGYHRASGDPILAHRCATQGLQLASTPRQPFALIGAHRLLGELDTAAGRYTEARERLDTALALAEACAAPHERALTLLALADLRGVTDARDEALVLVDEARAVCAPLDARPALARADALAKRLSSARVAPGRRPAGLTAREVDVLRLVAQGLTDSQVAEKLFLSPRTVSTHLTSVYTKLGISSRAAATRFAIEHDLV